MTGQGDVLALLVDYHDNIVVPATLVADDVRRGKRRVRRNRSLVAGGVAVAVAGVVAVVSLLTGSVSRNHQQPADPTPPPTQGVNGEVTGAVAHFGVGPTDYGWRDFDPGAGRGLYVTTAGEVRLVVLGPSGQLASIPCRCPGTGDSVVAAALGPGRDEVTLARPGQPVRVLGYDGRLRRTIDLSPSLSEGEAIGKLAWSPGGRTLAVATGLSRGGGHIGRVWLVDERGSARLGYSLLSYHAGKGVPPLTLDPNDYDGRGQIWGLGGWSPNGTVLLLDVLMSSRSLGSGPMVVALKMQRPGAARAAIPQILYRSDRHFDWAGSIAWSPDGSRIAVRTKSSIVEISPVDGHVLAQHPHVNGWLVWPRADGP